MKILLLLTITFFTLPPSTIEEALAERTKLLNAQQKAMDRYISTPEWNPESEKDLPLRIQDAVKTAQKWALKKWPKAEAFKIIQINLKQMVSVKKMVSGSEGAWWAYHIIIFPEPWTDSFAINNGSEVVVNMDGEVERYKTVGSSRFVLTKL